MALSLPTSTRFAPHADEFDFDDGVAAIIADTREMRARTQEIAAQAVRASERAKVACREAERTVQWVMSVKHQHDCDSATRQSLRVRRAEAGT